MYLFQYVCRVDPEGKLARDKHFDKIRGAYVDVWICFAHSEGAEELARFYTRRAGWVIEKNMPAWKIKPKKCRKRDKRFIKEARKYGYSTVAWMWSKDSPNAAGPYENLRENARRHAGPEGSGGTR